MERSDISDIGNHNIDIEGGLETNLEALKVEREDATPRKIAVTRGFSTNHNDAC